MRQERDSADAEVARIAARQHGVVSSRQLREVGLSASAIARRRRAGRLHPVHRGVYAVGHPGLSAEGRWMAAVLAVRDSVLSHGAAAALWGLLPWRSGPVDVSVGRQSGLRRRRGIRVHRCRTLPSAATTFRLRIPTTSPARTLADLKRVVPAEVHRRALRQAAVLGLTVEESLPRPTRSELEDLFLDLCRRHRLPEPEVNVPIDSMEVDFLWRAARLVVETDGYRFHRGRVAFEEDRARDLRLRRLGYDVIRLTFRQVTREPQAVARLIERELARARARASWR